jgi:hypothetical protein
MGDRVDVKEENFGNPVEIGSKHPMAHIWTVDFRPLLQEKE